MYIYPYPIETDDGKQILLIDVEGFGGVVINGLS